MIPAILILGPTGSGKTPLGDHLQAVGWRGRRCVHFDFGDRMRRLVSGTGLPDGFTAHDREVMTDALDSGRLLTDAEFPLIVKIFDRFATDVMVGPNDFVILNGMPRHAGQARDISALVDIRLIIVLEAAPEVIVERIGRNAGGDRAGRSDDLPGRIRDRLVRYEERTRPLIAHFRSAGVPIVSLAVGVATTAADLAAELDRIVID